MYVHYFCTSIGSLADLGEPERLIVGLADVSDPERLTGARSADMKRPAEPPKKFQ